MQQQKNIKLDIVSAEEQIFSGEVKNVYVTGELGELGISHGHTALLTSLKPGNLRAEMEDDKEEIFYISGGMLEVQPSVVTVLSDTVLRAHDIDEAAAIEAKEHAEQALSNKKSEIDFAEASAELAQALAQLRAIQQLRNKIK